ncbi:MAG: DNA-3-methyladenine glycosylase 2 family protein [Chitinophagaceae bacterium]|nr:DNA-3-methyladenine glycosylase 2 family protein [Chitinophagaceae bacterium]
MAGKNSQKNGKELVATTYQTHFEKDKKFVKLIQQQGVLSLSQRKNLCIYLCGSIMSQQLSVKVAAVIYQRFLDLFNGKEPTPEQILSVPLEKLRSIGLSNAKSRYVHNVAQFAIDKGMDWKTLNKMSSEEVIEYLTEIKGVGRWTVEMLLMFALGRPDVFAIDDLGIQNAMIGIYKLSRDDKKKFKEDMIRISSKWSPYRTFACMHLWRWKDQPK